MNTARIAGDAGLLERDPELDAVALVRARALVSGGYFDHYGPDGESAFTEMAFRGIWYRLAGENLARNTYAEARSPLSAFESLMGSPGHRANILEARYARVGVAAVRDGRMLVYVTVFTD